VWSVRRALAKHRQELGQALTKHRDVPDELRRLQADIMAQVDRFHSLLTNSVTSSDFGSTPDLGSLAVIHEVSDLV